MTHDSTASVPASGSELRLAPFLLMLAICEGALAAALLTVPPLLVAALLGVGSVVLFAIARPGAALALTLLLTPLHPAVYLLLKKGAVSGTVLGMFSLWEEFVLGIVIVASVLRRRRPLQMCTADWVALSLLAIGVTTALFHVELPLGARPWLGLRDDMGFLLLYAAGRVIDVPGYLRRRFVRLGVCMGALLGAVGVVEFFVLGPALRLWLVGIQHIKQLPAGTSFLATNFSGIRASATLASPLSFGALMMALLLLWAAYASRLGWGERLLVPILLAGLVCSLTRSAWAGLIVGLGVLGWRTGRRAKVALVVLAMVAAVALLSPLLGIGKFLLHQSSDTSLNAHLQDLDVKTELVLSEPLGSGPGTVGPRAVAQLGSSATSRSLAESAFLTMALEYGWIGGLLFAAFCFLSLRALWQGNTLTAVAASAILAGAVCMFLVLPQQSDFSQAAWVWPAVGLGIQDALMLRSRRRHVGNLPLNVARCRTES